jgi:hypothetical protein
MLNQRGSSWPLESKHLYGIHENQGHHRGPSTRGKRGRSLGVTQKTIAQHPVKPFPFETPLFATRLLLTA